MKPLWIYSLVVAVFVCLATGCSNAPGNGGGQSGKLKIIATTFPEYDWTRQILGKKITVCKHRIVRSTLSLSVFHVLCF